MRSICISDWKARYKTSTSSLTLAEMGSKIFELIMSNGLLCAFTAPDIEMEDNDYEDDLSA